MNNEDMASRIAKLEALHDASEKTAGNHITEINRRLESIQQNIAIQNATILEKIGDKITIATQQIQIKNEENNKHFAKGLVENIKKVEEKTNDTAQQLKNEITFVKRLGFLFAFLLSTILAIKEYIFK